MGQVSRVTLVRDDSFFAEAAMTRAIGVLCCALVLAPGPMLATAGQSLSPETTATVTATIEAVDKENRTVRLKPTGRDSVDVKVPEDMQGFNTLRTGDQVTATYFADYAVDVRKAGDTAPPATPQTTTQRKERTPGSETRMERTFRVTVEAIDPKAPSLTVKGPQGRVVTLGLRDASQLKNIQVGDTVDVKYFQSLLIKVSRPTK